MSRTRILLAICCILIVPASCIFVMEAGNNSPAGPFFVPGPGNASSAVLPDPTAENRTFLTDPDTKNQYVAGEVIVRFNRSRFGSDTDMDTAMAQANAGIGAQVQEDLSTPALPGLVLVRLPATLSVQDAVATYSRNPGVIYAEPNYRVITLTSSRGMQPAQTSAGHPDAPVIPDDPEFTGQYYLRNTGQAVSGINGTPGADINATAAWGISTGSGRVIVGIVDTGINTSAPDLAENLWENPETGGNGANFTGGADNERVTDTAGHGTGVAGILGAVTNNSAGGAGVAWHLRIMALKVFETGGGDATTTTDLMHAIRYADAEGVSISCFSWISAVKSRALEDVMGASPELFVAAAGNLGTSNDATPYYPAAYRLPNLITVAATDQNDRLAPFSNYGLTSVDLAAPGTGILVYACDDPGDGTVTCGYYHADGTSMAVPQVAGVAALVKSVNPSLTAPQIKTLLLTSTDVLPSLAGKVNTSGRLDAYKAVLAAQDTL